MTHTLDKLDLPGLNWLITVPCWWGHEVKKKTIDLSSILFWVPNFFLLFLLMYRLFLYNFRFTGKKWRKHILSIFFITVSIFTMVFFKLVSAHLNRFYILYFYKTFWTDRLLTTWVGICRDIFQLLCVLLWSHGPCKGSLDWIICLVQSVHGD